MKRYALSLFLFAALPLFSEVTPKPKLVLLIVADQFRSDYLQRFRADYREGFDLLLTKGAVFIDANLDHLPTYTAPGHSTLLTGATPSMSGIIGNQWFDRAVHKSVTSVSDDSARLLGDAAGAGASPRQLLVSTVGDELKIADQGRSRVIGISLKDRGAILPAGHMADGAFWFDFKTGCFVSSTYYFPELPAWVKEFNAGRRPDSYSGAQWFGRDLPKDSLQGLYASLEGGPFGNELVEGFAERAVRSAQLGQRDVTDLLTISFSSNDFVGHQYGPDSPEVRDVCIRTDRLLGKLFKFVDAQVGLQNVLLIFTSDHGAAPLPEVNAARKMPGGRVLPAVFQDAVQTALSKKYGAGQWIEGTGEIAFYLNRDLIGARKLDQAEVERTAANALLALPHVFRVYTRSQLMDGLSADPVARRVTNSFSPQRSGDIIFILDPYWVAVTKGTAHISPFAYDTHIPLIFMGTGIRAGNYYKRVAANDIAPTLAAILGIQTPSGSVGRILAEMF